MSCDIHDTIAAIASAPRGAARGVVRISGPDVVQRLTTVFRPDDSSYSLSAIQKPSRIPGVFRIAPTARDGQVELPGHLLLWPSSQSYTRQPSAEFHAIGSLSLLTAIVNELARLGIRAAEPGEFTMRAFLAGRVDLTQAEAVLGVIDARERDELDAALDQMAGGLSRPLYRIREHLLMALVELEAGLDFVEEDIEFISRAALCDRLDHAKQTINKTLDQLSSRDMRQERSRVVIIGPPNVGKSSLFNALIQRFGNRSSARSIVSSEPGATRDYVSEEIALGEVECLLVDTAGHDTAPENYLHRESQAVSQLQEHRAEVRLFCFECTQPLEGEAYESVSNAIIVLTKGDLPRMAARATAYSNKSVMCSSVTGAGLDELAKLIRAKLVDNDRSAAASTASTSARCLGALREADNAIGAALELTKNAGEELIAAEIRSALDALGDVVGATTTDDVLDRIFSQFCIGK